MARLSIAAGGLALLIVILIGAAVTALTSPGGGAISGWCLPSAEGTAPGSDPADVDLDPEQADNARVIITVGQGMQVPPRGWVIAIATALQESGLRNLPHLGAENDHDSLGLFQQRPSQGWGTPEQITDPVHASTVFYERLLQVDNWQQLPLTQAAQLVQRSAFPSSYARHEPRAIEIVAALSGVHCGHISAAGWTLPVGTQIVSGFRTAARPTHYGIDFTDGRGTTVRAAAAGTVTQVTCQATLNGAPYSCDIDGSPQVTGCGWHLDILHTGGAVTRYCHLLTRPHVTIGDQVTAGQPIGQVGSSGNSSGPHLHFEIELHRPIAQHPGGVTIERHRTDPVAFYATQGITITCATSSNHCQPVHGDREPDAHLRHHVADASDVKLITDRYVRYVRGHAEKSASGQAHHQCAPTIYRRASNRQTTLSMWKPSDRRSAYGRQPKLPRVGDREPSSAAGRVRST
jgi:murein DD-endopeptidase MepM/ murein hydrolase activator NlpD